MSYAIGPDELRHGIAVRVKFEKLLTPRSGYIFRERNVPNNDCYCFSPDKEGWDSRVYGEFSYIAENGKYKDEIVFVERVISNLEFAMEGDVLIKNKMNVAGFDIVVTGEDPNAELKVIGVTEYALIVESKVDGIYISTKEKLMNERWIIKPPDSGSPEVVAAENALKKKFIDKLYGIYEEDEIEFEEDDGEIRAIIKLK